MDPTRWDERYAKPGYSYGTDPNRFLVSVVDRIPSGRVLCLGDGEGRNGVYLAQQGFEVTSLDQSGVGLEKVRALAAERGVAIETMQADLADFAIEPGAWHGIVSIFCHFQPALRTRVHHSSVRGLAPGGAFVLEAFTPRQLEYQTGGPREADRLVSLAALEQDLAGLDFAIGQEIERQVIEGDRHTGLGAVVQVLAFKATK